MKRTILLTIMAACMLLQCCARTTGAREVHDHTPYAEEIARLDSLRWLIGGAEYPEGFDVDADSLEKVWTGFAGLYSDGKYKEAYDFLRNESRYGNVIIYLRNTTAFYEFVSGVWNECVSSHACSDEEYFREMEEEYFFALAMTRSVVELGGEDPYVPAHYLDMVMELGSIIMSVKDYDKAETYDDEIYHASMSMYGHDLMARLLALSFRYPLLCRTGREEQAQEALASFRIKAMEESRDEELEKLLMGVDAIEKSMKQE